MFDIGFTELLLIGVVALIVVGPKDLPGMFRTLGRFTARARAMGREFSQAMSDAADESGAKDIASTLKSATSPKNMGLDALNKAADGFEKWDPSKSLKETQETPELEADRAEVARKIHDATAKTQAKKRAAEAAKAEAPTKASTTKAKTAAKKPAVKKPAAKKPAAKKPAAKKTAAKKPATKSATKKTAAKSKSKPADTSDA